MTSTEFIEASEKLEKYYDKEYTHEQTKIMYEELKTLSIERYRKVISQCLKTCKFLPKVADMIKANMEIRERDDNKEKEKIKCEKCNSTGYVFFSKIITEGDKIIPYTYCARCICENAKYANKKIPTYQEFGIEINNRIEQVNDTMRDINEIKRKFKYI